MTIFLNRFHKSNWLVIFLVAAVIGGAFEAFVSLFMQYAFGAVAWDYSNMPGSLFGGRTCLPFMACWGLLGVVWIKLLLPFMLRLVNFIPWNWRYMLTTVAACFMLVDAVMTLQALDCWYMRLSHDPIDTPIQQFYDHEFGDTYMAGPLPIDDHRCPRTRCAGRRTTTKRRRAWRPPVRVQGAGREGALSE